MYCVLLVSSDRELCFLGIRFSPMLDPDITLRTAEDIPQAINIMKSLPVDAVVFDQDEVNDISKFIVATDRNRVTAPVILVSKNPTMDLLREAIDLRIDGFIPRSGRDPSDFFGEVNMRASIIAERRRNENYRRINESRMEALVKMASMGEEDFQTIVRYALEKSVELTHSKIGYVALYERERGMLNMLAWSSQAMKGCEVSNYPVEFELNSTGIWGEPIRLGKSITINDYENDRKSMKKGTPAGHVKLEKLLMVPIIVDGEIIGTAGVGNKDSEYTTFDETQLNLMMTELFSIYKSRETFRHEVTRSNAARTLMESGPVGFMYIDSDMNIIFSNRVAADIVGFDVKARLPLHLDSIGTRNVVEVKALVNSVRLDPADRTLRSHISGDGNTTYECAATHISEGNDIIPGFMLTFTDITDVVFIDTMRLRAIEHIRVLEGPVLNTLISSRRALVPLGDITDDAYPALVALDNTVTFMDDYRNVGISEPQWFSVRDLVEKAVKAAGVGNMPVDVKADGISILVDPEFPVVFKNLLTNSASHGGSSVSVSISCRINQGNLTMTYCDNGVGIPEYLEDHLFDQVPQGKFGMFLIKNVVDSNGFTIRHVPTGSGTCFEIGVSPAPMAYLWSSLSTDTLMSSAPLDSTDAMTASLPRRSLSESAVWRFSYLKFPSLENTSNSQSSSPASSGRSRKEIDSDTDDVMAPMAFPTSESSVT